MNHNLWTATSTRVIALMFVVAGLAACGDRISDTHASTPAATPPDASAVVVGTAPAQPTGDPPGTTPVASNTSDVTASVESHAMPQPGQPNDHSNVAPTPSQKSGEIATTEAEGKSANAGERTR
jgi:hypothetical protein